MVGSGKKKAGELNEEKKKGRYTIEKDWDELKDVISHNLEYTAVVMRVIVEYSEIIWDRIECCMAQKRVHRRKKKKESSKLMQ